MAKSAAKERDSVDEARAPGHAGDDSAGDPQVETSQLHSLISEDSDEKVPRDHFQVDRDAYDDLLPVANDEDR